MMMTVMMAALVAAVTVDANLPAGNVVVEKIDGDTVSLSRELRDTAKVFRALLGEAESWKQRDTVWLWGTMSL